MGPWKLETNNSIPEFPSRGMGEKIIGILGNMLEYAFGAERTKSSDRLPDKLRSTSLSNIWRAKYGGLKRVARAVLEIINKSLSSLQLLGLGCVLACSPTFTASDSCGKKLFWWTVPSKARLEFYVRSYLAQHSIERWCIWTEGLILVQTLWNVWYVICAPIADLTVSHSWIQPHFRPNVAHFSSRILL